MTPYGEHLEGNAEYINHTTKKFMVYYKFKMAGKKTFDIDVRNKDGDHLGTIKWRAGWRRYVFEPDEGTIFDASCMEEIVSYIRGLINARSGNTNTIKDRLEFAQEHWKFTFEMQELFEFVMWGKIPKEKE